MLYEYAGISLVVIEASKWLLYRGEFYCMTVINKLCYRCTLHLIIIASIEDMCGLKHLKTKVNFFLKNQ